MKASKIASIGGQLPRWPPMMQVSWWSFPTLTQGWSVWLTSKPVIKVYCGFCLALRLFTLRGAWGDSSGPLKRPSWAGTEASHQQPASTCQPCDWATSEVDPQPSQAFRWPYPKEAFDCNLHLKSNPEAELLRATPRYLTRRNHEQ